MPNPYLNIGKFKKNNLTQNVSFSGPWHWAIGHTNVLVKYLIFIVIWYCKQTKDLLELIGSIVVNKNLTA